MLQIGSFYPPIFKIQVIIVMNPNSYGYSMVAFI